MELNKAIDYASRKHDGQKRKLDETPYISHPFRVGMLLLQDGLEEDIVTAGLLHDVVEDTDGTLEEISQIFGEKVAQLVAYASEPDKSLSWHERKQHTIETIKNAPLEAKLVVCADKIDNLTSILEKEHEIGITIWDSFKAGKEKQKWYYSSIYNSLVHELNENEHPALFNRYKKMLETFV
ncbi:HD domain-containing protein [Aquibacillus saliphilus]|uniref:HD domain-containing protein n=1 Tax=Aquibacillus saliphilus TaxID=1909422 RepID=UPI001CF0443F|nr:HD domain-containing protein [Aquibacillus saliphilus]